MRTSEIDRQKGGLEETAKPKMGKNKSHPTLMSEKGKRKGKDDLKDFTVKDLY